MKSLCYDARSEKHQIIEYICASKLLAFNWQRLLRGWWTKEWQKSAVIARIDSIREKKKSRRKWCYKIEEDLKIIWIRNWYAVAGHWMEWVSSVCSGRTLDGMGEQWIRRRGPQWNLVLEMWKNWYRYSYEITNGRRAPRVALKRWTPHPPLRNKLKL